jgi:hypothetical protein
VALNKGMLEEFKSFSSQENTNLLQINLSEGNPIYGYLRKVGEDFFVMQTVKSNGAKGIILSTKSTKSLHLIKDWDEISPSDVPPDPGSVTVGSINLDFLS